MKVRLKTQRRLQMFTLFKTLISRSLVRVGGRGRAFKNNWLYRALIWVGFDDGEVHWLMVKPNGLQPTNGLQGWRSLGTLVLPNVARLTKISTPKTATIHGCRTSVYYIIDWNLVNNTWSHCLVKMFWLILTHFNLFPTYLNTQHPAHIHAVPGNKHLLACQWCHYKGTSFRPLYHSW